MMIEVLCMNNKGFTLVELIAVITIIAIILVITTTSIGKTIEKQRKETFIDTVNGITKTAELYTVDLSESSLTNGYYVFTYEDSTLKFNDDTINTTSKLEDGTGYIYVDANGNSYAKMYKDNRYCYIFTVKGDVSVTASTSKTECLSSSITQSS